GVSVVNGSMRVGRRRLALAHELGHYLVADEYTVDWRVAEYQDIETRENLLDRFARALLLPANGLRQAWAAYTNNDDDDLRSTAVRVASQYRVDMATLARRLHELRIVGYGDVERVRAIRTNRADIVEMGLVVVDELAPPSLSSEYVKSVLRLYRSETVSMERAIDLLFDTWDEEMLPDLPPRSEDEIWQFI
ncbi:MAG TPA: ImmA/IrrE family metallo-endopeptidase, partial [Pseudonocardiaceae bacterium]|nr:ImmA/IrrE family metallo-endopeptidase [Pseudonocardiaceae bacterium]